MTDSQIRVGGNIIDSGDYVSTDQTTILGDGTAANPLRATPGGAPLVVGHYSNTGESPVAISPTDDVAFLVAALPGPLNYTLTNGLVDGHSLRIIDDTAGLGGTPTVITPASFKNGSALSRAAVDPNASTTLVWSALHVQWVVLDAPLNFTIVP